VDADGDFLLLACPGSGKTRSAAARVARLAATPGVKVAACSYTNIGAERIGAILGGPVAPQHFLGTVHAFLLRYVVYPFAHLAGAKQGPVIRAGDWPTLMVHGDHRQRMALDDFRYGPDGNLVVCRQPRSVKGTPEEIIASVGVAVRARKTGFFKAGVLSADDAMWVAVNLLRKRPELSRAVAGRFDEVLIDEAQDTSELQLACISELAQSGELGSLVLIGDLEQSIYSFQGASAAGCRALADDHDLREIPLAENHRCSQKICDAAAHFCAREKADTAVGHDRFCPIDPEVAVYPPADPQQAMDTFRARLNEHGIETHDAAVLARGHTMVDALAGATSTVKIHERPERIARIAVALAQGTLTQTDIRYAERTVAHCAFGSDVTLEDLDDEARADVRAAACAFLSGLPVVQGDLRAWITAAKGALDASARVLLKKQEQEKPKTAAGSLLQSGAHHEGLAAEDVFTPPARDLTPQTVHSIKGEDREAVMMVVRKPHGADPTRQLDLFHAVTTGADIEAGAEEERRVTFVALTRARRYCLVALPDTTRGRKVAAACTHLGFARIA
jgi:DNA helicase-2/ATP-dependent DNA helicase PcrA